MNNISIFAMDGVPMVDTITIANVCRNGKTNNVYRMALRLAEIGEQGIVDLGGRPAKCAMSQKAFHRLASRFYRHKDEPTAIGVVAINNAFEAFMNTIVEGITTEHIESADQAIAVKAKMECAPIVADISKDIAKQFMDAMNGKIADVEMESVSFEDSSVEMKMACRINEFIEETQKRINHQLEVVFDALRDVIRDMMDDVEQATTFAYNLGMRHKQSESDSVRSELDALRRMLKPEKPSAIQTLNGNVSVQQCAAWLTSNGIKDMGEIRLYEWMRNNGLVCTVGTSRNLPTQIALEKGLLVSVSNPYNNPRTGERMNSFTTRVTPKGQAYLFNRLMYYQINPKK